MSSPPSAVVIETDESIKGIYLQNARAGNEEGKGEEGEGQEGGRREGRKGRREEVMALYTDELLAKPDANDPTK